MWVFSFFSLSVNEYGFLRSDLGKMEACKISVPQLSSEFFHKNDDEENLMTDWFLYDPTHHFPQVKL